jgi:hypothetical protein
MKIDRMMAKEGYAPVSVAATLLGVAPSTLYRKCDAGLLSGKQVGSHWYLDTGSVARHFPIPGLFDQLQEWARFTVAGDSEGAQAVLDASDMPDIDLDAVAESDG